MRDLVFGYINNCQRLFPSADQLLEIPQEAYLACLTFYHDRKTHRHYGEMTTQYLILRDTLKREQSLAVLTSDNHGLIRFCEKYLKSKVSTVKQIEATCTSVD